MYIGVDIGGSKILVVSGDKHRKIIASEKVPTPETAAQGVAEITHLIEKVAQDKPIEAIVVAAPGPINQHTGVLFPTPTPNVPWPPVDIQTQLRNHFHVPVAIEKDANVAALAEAVLGAGKGHNHVLYVTISTGVGTGLIIDGEIYHGANDPEGGHMYIAAEGTNEEFEMAASGKALKRRFGLYGYEITDPAMWDAYATDLATGLRNLITILSPEVVVLGGGVAVHFAKFERFLHKHLAELKPIVPDPPIVAAKHIETAVAYGTLVMADRLVHPSK